MLTPVLFLTRETTPMIDDIFGDEGILSQHLDGYIPRPGQMALAKAVEDAIYDERHLLAEGPTGTGKSMAYGMPAALYALSRNETVVVATANINLQEQLYRKDMPLIAKALNGVELQDEDENGEATTFKLPPLRYALVKGMGNYLCVDTFEESIDQRRPMPAALKKWAQTTSTGDKSELKLEYPPEEWRLVSTTPDECLRHKCTSFDECHVFRTRNMEPPPHVIITNYHMLYTDIMLRQMSGGQSAMFPSYSKLILDECHKAVDIAMDFHGFDIAKHNVLKMVRRLRQLGDTNDALKHAMAVERCTDGFFDELKEYRDQSHDDLFIRKPLQWDNGIVAALDGASGYIARRGEQCGFPRTAAKMQALAGDLFRASNNFRMTCFGLPDKEEIEAGVEEAKAKHTLPQGSIFYVEKSGKFISLKRKVVAVQSYLQEHLFGPKTVVATSATMTTGGNFKFLCQEMGLKSGDHAELIAPSPFNDERTLLMVPKPFPCPSKERGQHMDAVPRLIEELVNVTGGRTMGLFTSYKGMQTAGEYLEKALPDNFTILQQGKLQKRHIIESFKEDPENSIILAVASFWEGVDIPGQALSCLVIDKFPFLSPEDPVLKFMTERYLKMGEGPWAGFMKYSVPKAIISLKQGVGRLIRTESDYGTVVICDNRIHTKSYGRTFKKVLPRDHCTASSVQGVADFLGDWAEDERQQSN
jgi:ATP-dependent DNA helicase DinG